MLNGVKKLPFVFRVTRSNRFTIPVLMNILEKNRLNDVFEIHLAESFQSLSRMAFPEGGIIAYSFMTPQVPEVFEEIRKLKGKIKDPPLLLAGGPHAGGDGSGTLGMGFDAVVCGDGENGLPLFCRGFLEGEDMRNAVIQAPPIEDLDDSFPISRTDPLIPPLEIGRGCFYGCAFCQTRGRKPLYRSEESIEAFFKGLVERGYVFRTGFICPSGFEYGRQQPDPPDPARLEHMLASARSKGIRYLEYAIFPSEVRPDTVTHAFLEVVRKYCTNRKITIGAQSGSGRILKREARGHTAGETERAAALIREHGFKPQIDFIIGFPEETEDDRILTLEQMKNLAVRQGAWNQVHYFQPLSGTPGYGKKPAALSRKTVQMLDEWTRNGYASDWWKKGMATAENFQRYRDTQNLKQAAGRKQ
jgi:B12-binding domain/radical SAM domain protein